MLLRINPKFPEQRKIHAVVDCLKQGGVIIYPTDSVYGFGCDITKQKAIEKICRIKGINPDKANFSFICHDLKHLSDFCRPVETPVYKLMKRNLPGPFTFILKANSNVPKILKTRKKTVGIRVPDNEIARKVVLTLSNPILSSTVHADDDILEFATNPEQIHEKFKKLVDIVVDGGIGGNMPSTVVDCTSGSFRLIRQGKGILVE